MSCSWPALSAGLASAFARRKPCNSLPASPPVSRTPATRPRPGYRRCFSNSLAFAARPRFLAQERARVPSEDTSAMETSTAPLPCWARHNDIEDGKFDSLCRLTVPCWNVLLDGNCITSMYFSEPLSKCVPNIVMALHASGTNRALDGMCPQILGRCVAANSSDVIFVLVLARMA